MSAIVVVGERELNYRFRGRTAYIGQSSSKHPSGVLARRSILAASSRSGPDYPTA